MEAYRSTTSEQLSLCLSFTGLRYTSCTQQNGCRACYDTNYCTQEIDGFGAQFAYGIMNFSETYTAFNKSYSSFLNLTSSINSTNYGTDVPALYAAALNVSSSSQAIPDSDIFPVQNVSTSQLSSCPYTFSSTPWYCGAKFIGGFCPSVWFNSTNMSKILNQVSTLKSLPVYNATIYQYASSEAQVAQGIISAYNERTNLTLYDSADVFLSPLYNSTVKESDFILGKFVYPPLSNSLASLESKFSSFQSLTYNQNVTEANAVISSMIKNTSELYGMAASMYLPVYNTSKQNNAKISIIKLDYQQGHVPSELTTLESAQNTINAELSGKVNDTQLSPISANATSVSSKLSGISAPFSMGAFVKSTDYWFISAIFKGSANPSSPAYPAAAALLSLIIGLIIFCMLFMLIRPPKKQQHMEHMAHKRKKGSKNKLAMLGIAFIALVLIYPSITYYYAASANSFIPSSYFISKAASSNTIAVYKGSALQSCISNLTSTFSKSGKRVLYIGSASSSSTYSILQVNLKGTGSDSFSPNNGTTSVMVSYSSNNATGSISVYNNAGKQVSEFILNGGSSESGNQTVSGSASGTWSVKYNISSSASFSAEGISAPTSLQANSITISNAISSSIPTIYASNQTVYKGLLGYVMYMNSSMLGSACPASSLFN